MTAAATSNMIDGYSNLVRGRNTVKYLTIFTSREATRHTRLLRILTCLGVTEGDGRRPVDLHLHLVPAGRSSTVA
jgi:hypothetical protein